MCNTQAQTQPVHWPRLLTNHNRQPRFIFPYSCCILWRTQKKKTVAKLLPKRN